MWTLAIAVVAGLVFAALLALAILRYPLRNLVPEVEPPAMPVLFEGVALGRTVLLSVSVGWNVVSVVVVLWALVLVRRLLWVPILLLVIVRWLVVVLA